MKKYIFIINFFVVNIIAIAQNCTDVEELFRKRHTIANMTWGHPYTTFDRHNKLDFPPNLSVGIFLPLQAKLNIPSHKRSFVPPLDELDNTSHSEREEAFTSHFRHSAFRTKNRCLYLL